MFSDVGDPQPVRFSAGELAVDEVLGCDRSRGVLEPALQWQPDQAGVAHQPADLVVADDHPAAEAQFGVHAWCAIGAAWGGVDLGDQICEPGLADRRG